MLGIAHFVGVFDVQNVLSFDSASDFMVSF
jgi:hypothetical protein